MIIFYAGSFYQAMHDLEDLEQRILRAIEKRDDKDFINKSETDSTYHVLQFVELECKRAQLNNAVVRIGMFPLTGIHPELNNAVTLGELKFELKALREAIANALYFKHFMLIPDDKVDYYDEYRNHKGRRPKMPPLFGQKVHRNFRSTRDDVKEAGNCFATGRYTACVFHCMRVLEKGLHALVHDLQNRFNASIKLSRTVEETNWGTIIDEIQHALSKPNRLAVMNPKPLPSDMNFYSKATREFDGFNDAWRKDVSHSRRSYNEDEAKAVMEHVKAFMQQISSRLHE